MTFLDLGGRPVPERGGPFFGFIGHPKGMFSRF